MIHYLSLSDVAAKSGLAVNTVKGYARKGLLPDPDATVGSHRGWLEESIDQWIQKRAERPKSHSPATGSPDPITHR